MQCHWQTKFTLYRAICNWIFIAEPMKWELFSRRIVVAIDLIAEIIWIQIQVCWFFWLLIRKGKRHFILSYWKLANVEKIELRKKRIHLVNGTILLAFSSGQISITKGMNSKVKIEQCPISKPQTKPNSKKEKKLYLIERGEDEEEENAAPKFCIDMVLIKKRLK